jgi:hypothetical protein
MAECQQCMGGGPLLIDHAGEVARSSRARLLAHDRMAGDVIRLTYVPA